MQVGSRRLALVAAVGLICQGSLAVSVAHAATSPGKLQQVVQRLPTALVPQFLLQAAQPDAPITDAVAVDGGSVLRGSARVRRASPASS